MPSVRCPGCQAVLRLKAAPPAGKRLKCPKCETRFAPKLKAAATAAPAPAEDKWGDEDWSKPAPAPRRTAGRAAGGSSRKPARKKGVKSGDGVPTAVWIGLAAVVVLTLGGVGVWAMMSGGGDAVAVAGGGNGTGEGTATQTAVGEDLASADGQQQAAPVRDGVAPPFPTDYFPAESDVFVHLKLAEVWGDPLVADLMPPELRFTIGAAVAPYGVNIADLESLTLAGPFISPLGDAIRQAMGESDDPGQSAVRGQQAGMEGATQSVAVLRLAKDVDLAQVNEGLGDAALTAYPLGDGVSGVAFQSGAESALPVENVVLWQPDPRTLVVAARDRIAAVAAGSEAVRRPGFAMATDGTIQILIAPERGMAVLPSQEEIQAKTGTIKEEDLPSAEAYGAFQRTAAGVGIAVDLAARPQTLTFTLPALRPSDQSEVAALNDAVTLWVEQGKDPANANATTFPVPMGDLGSALQDSVRQTTSDGVVTVTLSAPADLRERIEAMSAGMGESGDPGEGGFGPPGDGPPPGFEFGPPDGDSPDGGTFEFGPPDGDSPDGEPFGFGPPGGAPMDGRMSDEDE